MQTAQCRIDELMAIARRDAEEISALVQGGMPRAEAEQQVAQRLAAAAPKRPSWTSERLAALRTLVRDGTSAEDIASQLGTTVRSVRNMTHRMRLTSAPPPKPEMLASAHEATDVTIGVDADDLRTLRKAAQRRDLPLRAFLSAVVHTICFDSLIAAVCDDGM